MPRPIIHTSFAANNPPELAKWYSDLFGWTWVDFPDMQYATAEYSETPQANAGFSSTAMGTPVGQVMVYIYSDDVNADLQQIADLGGTIVQHPIEIPGVGDWGVFLDPSGNRVSLLKPSMTART
jgi:predicted enzyme related to lactoylglutathione lyase